ncbi:MAG: CpaF family protein [Chloroflexi bacterium]|jgi:pilus assembly protein CpaF|nr:CpaF family protein [Chloroflexota bacterium]
MSKKFSVSLATVSLGEIDKAVLLRAIYDKLEAEPPVGERYPFLLRKIITNAINELGVKLAKPDEDTLTNELYSYIASYGPIEQFFNDPAINEIMVNEPDQIYIEKNGELILTDAKFDNNDHIRFTINHIINPLGQFVNHKHPTIDSRLPDGSRVNAVIPPASPMSPCITIRRFLKDKLSLNQLIELSSLTPQIAEFLSICVKARLNIIVAGNTGSGKTTLLNILAASIPDSERIVTIEDSAELKLLQFHKITLEAQAPDFQGEGKVTVRDLVRNSLRMRPDRIIVGEVRGGEALDMLQAMNTGHDGSMTTVHSNSARDTVSRLETMVLMAGFDLPVSAIRRQISSALNLIVYLNRFPDGSRRVTQVTEVMGMEGEVVTMTDLFQFHPTGVNDKKKITGVFHPTGLRPSFSRELEEAGFTFHPSIFQN